MKSGGVSGKFQWVTAGEMWIGFFEKQPINYINIIYLSFDSVISVFIIK